MMLRTAYRGILFVVLFSLLLCATGEEPPTVALEGDFGQIVWTDTAGQQVASLKRNDSVIELDAPLHAQEVYTEDAYAGNVSLSTAHEIATNLTERFDILEATNANLTAENDAIRANILELEQQLEDASLWRLNDNWFDLVATVDPGLHGFHFGFAAGDFAYYVPFYYGAPHGRAVRINMSDFSPSGVEWFDLVTTVDSGLVGFSGGFSVGNFAYYVPYTDGGRHGRVVRIDMSDFSATGVDWFDLQLDVNPGLVGFYGGFAEGNFAYYCPHRESAFHGRVVRIDATDFSATGVEWFDLETTVDNNLVGFSSGFAAGGYAYYVPLVGNTGNHGHVVRIDVNEFSPGGVEWFDLETTVDPNLVGFIGGFAGGEFAYYVPFNDPFHGHVVRIDMSDFSSSGVEWFDLATTVNEGLKGFYGGFAFDGFAYYGPYSDGTLHGRVVRIDESDFSPSGVEWYDLATSVNAELKGFRGAFTADGFGYFAPYYNGHVVRVKL